MYDHTQCPPTAHDRDPGTALDDGQPVDEHGLLLCRDCNMPLMYCTTFGAYDHVDPNAPPCFLVSHNGTETHYEVAARRGRRGWLNPP